jgi:hypothetical protein
MQETVREPRAGSTTRSIRGPAVLLGIGLGGLFDGIVLLSRQIRPRGVSAGRGLAGLQELHIGWPVQRPLQIAGDASS